VRPPQQLRFFQSVRITVILLVINLSVALSVKVHAEDNNPAELNRRIQELYRAGKFKEAIPLAEKLVVLTKRTKGGADPVTATSLNDLAELYLKLGDYAKAEPLFKETLEIRRKVLGPQHPGTAQSMNDLAELYLKLGDYTKAEPLFKEALEIRQKVLGRQHPHTAASLDGLAELYFKLGDFPKAEPLFKEALEIRQKVLGPQHPGTAQSLIGLAQLYLELDDYGKAEPLFKEALEIRQKVLGRDRPATAQSLDKLAALYQDIGDYDKAEPLYQEALEIRRKVLGREHPFTAVSLNNLAFFYWKLGDYGKAEPLFKEALEIRQKVLGPLHPYTAQSLNNLALLYWKLGDYAKAEPLYKEALEIRQKALGWEHRDTAQSLNSLALLYQAMGDYAKAQPLFEEALEIRQKVLGPRHPYTAQSLNNLAALYQTTGDYDRAEPLYKKGLEIRQEVLGPQHPDTAQSLNSLACLELDLGHIQEAERFAQLGYAAGIKAFSQVLSFGSEEQRLAYQHLLHPYALFAALDHTDALMASAVLHYKGVVLDSIIEDRLLAETRKEKVDRDLVSELSAKKRMVAQLSLQTTATSPKEDTERIQALEQEVEDIEGKLARQVAGLGQARRALTITVEQVQATLPNDTVLIEFVRHRHYLGKNRFRPHYGAVVLSADAPPRWVNLGSAKEIEATLKRYQVSVRNPGDEEEMAAVLQKIDNEVWKPVEQVFPAQTKRVIVSPDAQLNFLSFATLLDPEKHFIAEKYLIQYVTSGRDLLREPEPALGKQVIVMANPKFDRDIQLVSADPPSEGAGVLRGTEKRNFEDLSFEELGGTQKESAELVPKFAQWGWQASSLTGSDVSKRALMRLHSPYILHLATHGFFEPEDSTSEAIPNESLWPEGRLDLTKSWFFKNPMHRSGLALAGANTTIAAWKRGDAPPLEEDGILTAEDVSTLDLKGTWLVTLSACDTGSGEARAGEGVLGLRRGFVEAGAQNLLMSLWPISDEFTVQIMSDFYEVAHEGGNPPEALATVQRDWLAKLRKELGLARAVNLAGPFIMSSQGRQ